jgi:hypothetical protein
MAQTINLAHTEAGTERDIKVPAGGSSTGATCRIKQNRNYDPR